MVKSATKPVVKAHRPGPDGERRRDEIDDADDAGARAAEEAPAVEEQEEVEAELREALGEEETETVEIGEEPGEEEVALEEARAGEEAEEAVVEAGAEPGVVVEMLLRRTGVLPGEAEAEVHEEERLPPPRREDEFVCSVCFLIKPRTQLGDVEHRVCRDCLDPPDDADAR